MPKSVREINLKFSKRRELEQMFHSYIVQKYLRQYCRNILWKYYKIAKIFRNLSLMLLKYCNNFAMSAQNMVYAIFSKYFQN